jgi:hypothetical protein
MSTVLEIESAIQQLPDSELPKLTAWYDAYVNSRWDNQIASDVEAGALDFLIAEVKREGAAGTLRTFP